MELLEVILDGSAREDNLSSGGNQVDGLELKKDYCEEQIHF